MCRPETYLFTHGGNQYCPSSGHVSSVKSAAGMYVKCQQPLKKPFRCNTQFLQSACLVVLLTWQLRGAPLSVLTCISSLFKAFMMLLAAFLRLPLLLTFRDLEWVFFVPVSMVSTQEGPRSYQRPRDLELRSIIISILLVPLYVAMDVEKPCRRRWRDLSKTSGQFAEVYHVHWAMHGVKQIQNKYVNCEDVRALWHWLDCSSVSATRYNDVVRASMITCSSLLT